MNIQKFIVRVLMVLCINLGLCCCTKQESNTLINSPTFLNCIDSMDKPKEWYTDIFINKDVIEINDDWRAIVNGPVKNLKYHANESRITINYEQDFEGKTKGEAKFVIGTIDINRFTLNYAETMDFHYKDDSSRAMSRHGKCTVQNADLKIK